MAAVHLNVTNTRALAKALAVLLSRFPRFLGSAQKATTYYMYVAKRHSDVFCGLESQGCHIRPKRILVPPAHRGLDPSRI